MEEKDKIWPPAPLSPPPDGNKEAQALSPAVILPLRFLVGSVCQASIWWLVCYVVLAPFQAGLTLNLWLSTVTAGIALLSVMLCVGVRRRWSVFGTGFSVAMAGMFCVLLWLL